MGDQYIDDERRSLFSRLRDLMNGNGDERCGEDMERYEDEAEIRRHSESICCPRRWRGDRAVTKALRKLLMEVRDIQCKINSPRFGLAEIKGEVRGIEKTLNNGGCLLGEVKKEIREIECRLDNPRFGLAEIKQEIQDIEAVLGSQDYGLREIKEEIREILCKINNPCFGLAEIKEEVHDIEDLLGNEDFGLCEIKREIHDIEAALGNEDFGLEEIKEEVKAIQCKLDNPYFGLAEIKQEIEDIEAKLDRLVPDVAGKLTTGPVVADNPASSLVVTALNVTNTTQTVVVTVFDIGTCPNHKTTFATATLALQAKCARSFIFDKPPLMYEVQFAGTAGTFTAWTSTRTQGQSAPLSSSNFLESNTFRHSELMAQSDP